MRISLHNVSYQQMADFVNRIAHEYDDVYIETKFFPDGHFYAYIVIRTPEVDVEKIL